MYLSSFALPPTGLLYVYRINRQHQAKSSVCSWGAGERLNGQFTVCQIRVLISFLKHRSPPEERRRRCLRKVLELPLCSVFHLTASSPLTASANQTQRTLIRCISTPLKRPYHTAARHAHPAFSLPFRLKCARVNKSSATGTLHDSGLRLFLGFSSDQQRSRS